MKFNLQQFAEDEIPAFGLLSRADKEKIDAGLSRELASATYLTQADASDTYVTKEFASDTYVAIGDKVDSSTYADSATFAVSAMQDSAGNIISDTYITPSELLSNELLEIKFGKTSVDLGGGIAAVMDKYGIKIAVPKGQTVEVGDAWTAEFFIKSKNALTTYPASPAPHFAIFNSDNSVIALALSKDDSADGHVSESFFVGDTSISENYTYYDSLEKTLADGNNHYVRIETRTTDKDAPKANIAVYIDGDLVIGREFDLTTNNFNSLILGLESFRDNPCLDNLATFDKFRMLGNAVNLAKGADISTSIDVPEGDFEYSSDTLIIYQDGFLSANIQSGTPALVDVVATDSGYSFINENGDTVNTIPVMTTPSNS